MSKIHVLPDENLGGVLREFREVERKAKVGDKKLLPDGTILTAVEPYDRGEGKTPGMWFRDTCGDRYPYYNDDNNRLIEPTDIVHIDDARYRLVDRKAKVGEKVIIVETHPSLVYTELGEIVEIIETDGDTCGGMFKPHDLGEKGAVYRFQYLVLEPVEPAENELVTAEEGDDKSVIDLLANLARRVTELERQQKENRELIIKAFEGISGKDDEYTVEERVARLERTFTEYMRRVNTIETDIEELNTDLATIEETAKELERAHETLKRRQVIENIHVLKRRQERLFEEINAIYRRIDALDERTQPLVKPFGEESPFATVATIPTFKYSDLVGKTLKIYGGRDGEYATVFGYDESTGKSYVLFNGKETDN